MSRVFVEISKDLVVFYSFFLSYFSLDWTTCFSYPLIHPFNPESLASADREIEVAPLSFVPETEFRGSHGTTVRR